MRDVFMRKSFVTQSIQQTAAKRNSNGQNSRTETHDQHAPNSKGKRDQRQTPRAAAQCRDHRHKRGNQPDSEPHRQKPSMLAQDQPANGTTAKSYGLQE